MEPLAPTSCDYPSGPSTPPRPFPRRHKIHKSISMDTDCLQATTGLNSGVNDIETSSDATTAAFVRPNSLFLKCSVGRSQTDHSDTRTVIIRPKDEITSPAAVVIGPVEAPTPEFEAPIIDHSGRILEEQPCPRPPERRKSVACGAVDTMALSVKYKRNRSYSWKGFALRKKSSEIKSRSAAIVKGPSDDGTGPVGAEVCGPPEVAVTMSKLQAGQKSSSSTNALNDGGSGGGGGIERRERSAAKWRGAKFCVVDLRAESEEGAGQLSPVATVIRRLHILPKGNWCNLSIFQPRPLPPLLTWWCSNKIIKKG